MQEYVHHYTTTHSNRKNIYNLFNYIVSTWIVASFIKIYAFCPKLWNISFFYRSKFLFHVLVLPCVILSSRKIFCHLTGWSTKKNLFWKGLRNLKKPYDKNYIWRWSSSQNMPGLLPLQFCSGVFIAISKQIPRLNLFFFFFCNNFWTWLLFRISSSQQNIKRFSM